MKPPLADSPCRIDGGVARYGDANLSLDDGTVQHGLGLFETLAIRRARPLDLDAHLERMRDAAERLELSWPGDRLVRAEALAVADELGHDCGWLKLVMTDGGRRFVFGGELDPADEGRPATALTLPWRVDRRGPLAGLKTTSYAGHALGSRWAAARGADEGLWRNDRGHLTEGCRSSLFVVLGGALLTASVSDGILPGVIRALVLDAARARGLAVHEGKVRPERLARAREAFLTASVRGIRPLIAVDGKPIGTGEPGPVTLRIAADVKRRREAGAKRIAP